MSTNTVTATLYSLSTWSHEGGQAVTVHTSPREVLAALNELLSLVDENEDPEVSAHTRSADYQDGVTWGQNFAVVTQDLQNHGRWEWYSDNRETSFNITRHEIGSVEVGPDEDPSFGGNRA